MFSKILIANRGEIALRIIRACREMGVQSAVVYSTADKDAAYLKLADQAICIGDGRPYNTALIVLDSDFAPQWAKSQGLEDGSLEELASEPQMIEAVQQGIDEANQHLARVEQIKKFTVVQGDWLPGGDELTPTMKLKRKPIAEKYADEIEAMYSG